MPNNSFFHARIVYSTHQTSDVWVPNQVAFLGGFWQGSGLNYEQYQENKNVWYVTVPQIQCQPVSVQIDGHEFFGMPHAFPAGGN